MMIVKMKKNTFMEGAFVATFSILLCKVVGLLYVVPFYSIIGNKGGALYSYAYSIYAIFLSLSTCGIPIALSKLVSESNALKEYSTREEIYGLSKKMITLFGFILFLILFIFADKVAYLFIGNVKGGNTLSDVAMAVRVVSVSLLVVPQLSVTRGYLQGNKMITTTSISELLEQIVRVVIIVVGSYLLVRKLKLPINYAVYVSIFAATMAALSSYLYLKLKIHKNKDLFSYDEKNAKKSDVKILLKRIVFYALPFVIIDLVKSLYGMVDSFTVVKELVKLGYSASTAETIFGVINTWASKLNMIVVSIALGIVTSLIPNISGSFVKKDMDNVNKRINESYSAILYFSLPMSFGLSFLAQPVWAVFYGYDLLSVNIFRVYILQAITFCIYTIALNLAQSLNQSKLALGALFGSFIFKIVLNIPMMHFFEFMGIGAYYATIITNILVQGGASIVILVYLKKKFKFDYSGNIKPIFKIISSVIIMLLLLMLLSLVVPLSVASRFKSILIIALYSVVGAIIYILMSYKLGLLSDVFGDDYMKKIKKIFLRK